MIQNCVKSLLREDEKDRTCKRIVVKMKVITLMNRLFRKGMKLLSRGKSKLHSFTQKWRPKSFSFFSKEGSGCVLF